MASLIPKNGVIFNFAAVAPAPSKDYCQLLVSWDHVTFRLWKISLKQTNVSPVEVKSLHEDFLYDERTKAEVLRVFGKPTLEYIKGLAKGKIDFLPRMPRPLLLRILQYMDLEDISRLSLVSKLFWELCRCDDVWQQIYQDQSETPISDEMSSLAEAMGWMKLFFTNKLRLQVQLRRHISSKTELSNDSDSDDDLMFNSGHKTGHDYVREFVQKERGGQEDQFYYPEVMTPSGIRIEELDEKKGDTTAFVTES